MSTLSHFLARLEGRINPWRPPLDPTTVTPEERRVIEISRLLDVLRRHDRLSGTFRPLYRLKPPMTEAELSAWEARAGVTLPPDYRAFLRAVGRSGVGPDFCLRGLPDPTDVPLAAPFPYEAAVNTPSLPGTPGFETFHEEERGCLTLCHSGCGYRDFLVVTGAARGQVWADGRAGDQGMKPIFGSFTDWYEDGLRRALAEVVAGGGHSAPR